MTSSKHSALLLLVAVSLVPGLGCQGDWLDELLVHRNPTYTAEGEEACHRCHTGAQMRSAAENAHGNIDHPQTPATMHGCESCHGPASIHVSRAHGGRGFPNLIEFGVGRDKSDRDVQLDACLGCHADPNIGPRVIYFRGSSHDHKPIVCSHCHDAHAAIDPMKDRDHQSETCFKCHRKVREEHPLVRKRPVPFDRISCGACHDVHAAVGEGA